MNMADLDLKRSIYSEINEHSTVGEIGSTQDNDTNNRDNCDNRTGAVNWIKDTCRKLKRIEFLKYFKNQVGWYVYCHIGCHINVMYTYVII